MNNQKSKQEILDETQSQVFDNIYGKKARRRMIFNKLGRFSAFFKRIGLIFILLFFVFIIFLFITASPRYSDEETRAAEKRLENLLSQAGEYRSIFEEALEFLKDYPEYYKKVVNNIQDIEVKNGLCPYACIYSTRYYTVTGVTDLMAATVLPEANLNKKILVLNPSGAKRYKDKIQFASMLVHETDHVEYLESDRLRRAGLFIKCNPLLNPHISINSRLSDITHRVQAIEICAEKAQIRFHKITDTKSGYEAENGIYHNFPLRMFLAMRSSVSLFIGFVSSILSVF